MIASVIVSYKCTDLLSFFILPVGVIACTYSIGCVAASIKVTMVTT
jgi:hypothetical protein